MGVVFSAIKNAIGTKAAPAPLIRPQSGGLFGSRAMSKREALEQYKGWVYASARKVAQSAAMVDMKLYRSRQDRRGRDVDEPVWQHDAVELLERVNPRMTRFEFKQLSFTWLELVGEAPWAKVRPRAGAPPRELWPLRPDRVELVPNKDGTDLLGYVFTSEDGERIPFDVEDILFFRYPHPYKLFRGMGAVEAATLPIQTDEEAADWHRQFYKQGTQLGGVIETEGFLPQTEFDRIRAQFQERYAGRENAHKVALLTAGLKWRDTQMNMVDMDLLNGRRFNRDEQLAMFGTSPPIIGIFEDVNRASAEGAIFLFQQTEIAPRLSLFDEQVNEFLVPDFGDEGLWFKHDDPVPLNREIRERELRLLADKGGITLSELREAYGFQPESRFDIALAPLAVAPIGASGEIEGQNDEEGETRSLTRRVQNKAFNLQTAEAKATYWKQFDRRREQWVPRVRSLLEDEFRAESRAVSRAYRNGGEQAALREVDGRADAWKDVLTRVYTQVGADFAESTLANLKAQAGPSEVKQPEEFDPFESGFRRWMETVAAERVTEITTTTKELIRGVVRAAVEEGVDTFRTAEAIQRGYQEFGPMRAERIARTEVLGASNRGSHSAAEQSGMPMDHEWLATVDGREREKHAFANGQRRPLEEPFEVGGDQLMHPGDPSLGAGAKNLVWCRCVEVYHVRR